MMTKRLSLLFLLGLLLASLHAQDSLNLQQCIERAQKRNVEIRMAQLQQQQAQIAVKDAKAQRLPVISAGASENFQFGRGLTANNTYVSRNTFSTSFSANASLPIFTGFKIKHQKKQATADWKAALQDVENTKENLSIAVTQAYYQVLFQKELMQVAQDQYELSKMQHQRIAARYKVGKAARIEVSQAVSNQEQDHLQLVQRTNDYELALLDLSQLLEMPTPDSLRISQPENILPELTASPATIFATALQHRPQILAKKYRITSAEENIKIARSGYMPSLSLNGGIGTSYYKVKDQSAPAFGKQLDNNLSKSIGLSLNIPIFNRHATRHAIQHAKINLQTQQAQLDADSKKLYKEIQTAWYNAVSAQKKMVSSKIAAQVAEESFQLISRKYDLGRANITEYNEEKTKYLNAKTNSISARYDYLMRKALLDIYQK